MLRINLLCRVAVVVVATVLASVPGRGWTEAPDDESLPKVVPAKDMSKAAEPTDARPSSRRKQPTESSPVIADAPRPRAPRLFQLDPNEPARDILDLKAKVGVGVLDGTVFSRTSANEEIVEPDEDAIFARQIRALDAERRKAGRLPGELKPAAEWPGQELSPEAVALRQASWQLEQVAQMLEEHRQYKRADEVRQMADEMRKESRGAEMSGTSRTSFFISGAR